MPDGAACSRAGVGLSARARAGRPRAKTQQPQKGQWKLGTGQEGVRAHSSRGVMQGHGTSCVVGDRNTPR